MTILHSFLVGIFPLFLLLLLPNVIHQDLLIKAIQSILSYIPADEEPQLTINNNIRDTDQQRSFYHSTIFSKDEHGIKNQIERQRTNGISIRGETTVLHQPTSHTSRKDSNKFDDINEWLSKPKKTQIDRQQQQRKHQRKHQQKQQQHQQPTTHHTRSKQEKAQSIDHQINHYRNEYQNEPTNFYKALNYADVLRQRDLLIHDGGSIQKESIQVYKYAIKLLKTEWKKIVSSGGDVRTNTQQQRRRYESVVEETFVANEDKSIHGLLVCAYCNLGKQYYMANMFEKSVEVYSAALKLEKDYIDALNARGSSYMILGQFEKASQDYSKVLSIDQGEIVTDIFNGMTKVLIAKEDVVKDGWNGMVTILNEKIPQYEHILENVRQNDSPEVVQGLRLVLEKLKVMHLAMFAYHDHKTLDTQKAFYHLSIAHQYKMNLLPQYNQSHEQHKVNAIMQVFNAGFWPEGVGSPSKKLIFVVGFPRSGSTLLERVLDSHSDISGTGEDSIFNGMLDEIRNAIIEASVQQNPILIQNVVEHYAKKVENLVEQRWKDLKRYDKDVSSDQEENKITDIPNYFVDKMLTNYANIGFIHLLFPDALILHIFREPMDTLFSCYKHEFPPGNLDYTSDFSSLSHMYKNYRDVMTHWDRVLPNRVKHVKYEDLIHDLPRISKAIMSAIDLEFEHQMMEFHKKKQAVNTHSSVQVRKGVYKESINSWKKYEEFLRPLYEFAGSYVHHDFETNIY